MGCNSSKDGSSPSGASAQGGDSAPKDKPEDGNAQQSSANHEVTKPPSDEQVANGDAQDELKEISDERECNESQSQNKYEIPTETRVEDINKNKLEEDTVTGETDITDMSQIRDQNDNEENDVGQLQLEENGGEEFSTSEPQQTESGGETANESQAPEDS